MKALSVLFFVLVSYALQSQDLNIYYDVHSDSMWYMKDGKVVTDPVVKKGKQVYFHLVEFNNYIYKAKFKATNSTAPFGAPAPNNSVVKGLLSGLVSGFLPGAALPLLQTPLFGNLLGAMPQNPLAGGRGDQEDVEAFKVKLKELEVAKEEINQLSEDITARRKSLTALNSTFDFTNALCKDKNLKPSFMKELLLKHCSEIFLKSAKEDVTLDEIATLNTKLVEIPVLEKRLKERIASYDSGLKDLKKQREKLQKMDLGIDELYPLLKKLALSESQYETSASTMNSELEKQCLVGEQTKKTDYTNLIQQFYFKYHEIKENTFSYTHHSGVEQKYLIYELDLYQNDSAQSKPDDEKKAFKHIEIKVRSYGGTQIGISVGVSGSKFSEKPTSYRVRNGSIYGTPDDPYVPFITSLFNLSYDMGAYFTPAVSMGVGIPLSKNETVDNFGIFIGPGMFLGHHQSFMISAGAMFSKVSTLASGYVIGDKIDLNEGAIPLSKQFALGYFLSVTYNLSGN